MQVLVHCACEYMCIECMLAEHQQTCLNCYTRKILSAIWKGSLNVHDLIYLDCNFIYCVFPNFSPISPFSIWISTYFATFPSVGNRNFSLLVLRTNNKSRWKKMKTIFATFWVVGSKEMIFAISAISICILFAFQHCFFAHEYANSSSNWINRVFSVKTFVTSYTLCPSNCTYLNKYGRIHKT